MLTLRRGKPFITNLRIQWIRLKFPKKPGDNALAVDKAFTVQMLGSVDDVVSPEDNIDLVAGSDFVYIDVPFSGH